VQIHAVERWLDEGWSPWRIGYGTVTLVATGVAVYGYVREPHHPGAVWWLLAGTGVIAVWALGEMLRWRIKYRRLLAAREADPSASLPQPVSKLLAEGKGLQADIGSFSASWGANRPLPGALPGRIARWEANAGETLIHQPEIRALFEGAPHVDARRPISGQMYGRIEYEIRVLENITGDDLGDSRTTSDQDANAAVRVRAAIATYDTERVKRLRELHKEGHQFQIILGSNGDRSGLMGDIQRWEATALSALSYWPDLWSKFSNARSIDIFQSPKIEEVYNEVDQELEILQTAMKRLEG
jgi:hypothetical protein